MPTRLGVGLPSRQRFFYVVPVCVKGRIAFDLVADGHPLQDGVALLARLYGDMINVHVAGWRPPHHRWETLPPSAPRSLDVTTLRAGTPGLV